MDIRDELIRQEVSEFVEGLPNYTETDILETKGILGIMYDQLNKTRMSLIMLLEEKKDEMTFEEKEKAESITIDIYSMMVRVEDKVNVINEYLKG